MRFILSAFALGLVLSSSSPVVAKPSKVVFTVYGSSSCPAGFRPLYTGSVIYVLQGVNTLADGICWITPPSTIPFNNDPTDPRPVTVVGPCAVCGR